MTGFQDFQDLHDKNLVNPENPAILSKALLLNPNQFEVVPLPLQLFNLRRLISYKTCVAKEPVLEKAVGPRWIEFDIAGIKEPVSNHDLSFTTISTFVVS